MIEIKNLIKKFGDRIIYEDISLSFPKRGVVALVGDSGCGKTTLLNSIAGLDFDYDGEITIDNTNLKNLGKDTLSDYRIHNIGYVFQNFNLLNLDSVEANIVLPFESVSNSTRIIKFRKVKELAMILGIDHLLKEPVNKLSGGEKQRVAIARALINSPKVILCDEPTGALDEKNSDQIYSVLKKISSKTLIIIASHDIEGVRKIADQIIQIKDSNIDIETKEKIAIEEPNLLENNHPIRKGTLSYRFKTIHSLQKMKTKKYRSLITNGMLSLSLTGIGLSVILSTSVSNKIQEAFSSLINGNQIVVSLKQESLNSFSNTYSAPENKVNEIYEKYNYFIDGVGATYIVNFETFFQDGNDIYVSSTPYKISIPSLSARSVNDFKWLDDDVILYPDESLNLKDDQVILGLSYQDMVNLCFKLQILRNYSSLGHYIHEHGLFITMYIANDDWQYDDEQLFEVKAVCETNRSVFYHQNSLWNQSVFENMMRLPSNDTGKNKFPWEIFKLYYFQTVDEPATFLNTIFYDDDYQDYVFERTNSVYHPSLCLPGEICDENRVLVYVTDKYGVKPSHLKYLSNLDGNISDYYFISDFGYSSYASNLLSGFSKNVFVSCDPSKIDLAIDADTQLETDANIQIDLPNDVVQGNFLNGISGGLRFSSKFNKLIQGRKPINNNEIVISKGLAKHIDPGGDGIGKYLYIAGENSEFLSDDGRILKEYQTTKVVIVGLIDEEQNYLYHDSLWTISFFRDKLGVSSFNLIPKSVVIELDEKINSASIIKKLSKMFYEYNFSSPVNELTKSVDSTLSYANAILIAFSILATLISILLLGTVVLLNVLESKDEIRLLSILGIREREINSLFVTQSVIQGLIAFALSSIELVVVDFAISKALGENMHTSLTYSFNFLPIGIIFIFSIVLPYLTSLSLVKILSSKKRK